MTAAGIEKTGRIGQTLDGRYRVDGFLADGGMGVVYCGTQLTVGRPVAIKLLSPKRHDRQ